MRPAPVHPHHLLHNRARKGRKTSCRCSDYWKCYLTIHHASSSSCPPEERFMAIKAHFQSLKMLRSCLSRITGLQNRRQSIWFMLFLIRSEERRVGKGAVRSCMCWGLPGSYKKKKKD